MFTPNLVQQDRPSFEQQLYLGRIGESRIASWFMRRGYSVLPVYDINQDKGKGPQVFTLGANFVAPDMLVFKGKKIYWIEVKQKTVFGWHRLSEQWTTGIDRRHFHSYLRLSEIAPWPILLLFLHTHTHTDQRDIPWPCPVGLFGQHLAVLKDRINHESSNHGPSGMVYWTVKDLMLFAELQDVE